MEENNDQPQAVHDITVVEEESDDEVESQSSDEFNFADALTLRKNLSETFDKHVLSNTTAEIGQSAVSKHVAKLERKTSNNRPPLNKPPVPANTLLPPVAHARAETSIPLAVFLRVRPIQSSGSDMRATSAILNTIELEPPSGGSSVPTKIRTYPPLDSNAAKVVRGGDDESSIKGVKEFEFHQVFGPEETQQDLYNVVASPLVSGLFPNEKNNLIGQSALLLAYGVTNSGKTYTMMGDVHGKSSSHKWGVIPRAMQDIFAHTEGTDEYELRLCCMEVYNESIFDLLPKDASGKSTSSSSFRFRGGGGAPLKLRESRGQTFVRGLAKHSVGSVAEGMALVDKAKSKRHTSSNNINADSSRSHCICQLEIVRVAPVHPAIAEQQESDGTGVVGNGYSTDEEASQVAHQVENTVTLWIVDLAGSERSKRTGMTYGSARQKEAALINGSLMKLMRCFSIMRENQAGAASASAMVPFRESKLTHLFMNHLTGPSANRTAMIVNVNPCAADFDESQHVLSYAAAAKMVNITQGEYVRKRKGMGDDLEATHDYNGRPLKRTNIENLGKDRTAASRSSKIAKLVKKFSPKRFSPKQNFSKRNVAGDSRKRKAEQLGAFNNSSIAVADPAFKKSSKRPHFSRFGASRSPVNPVGDSTVSVEVVSKASHEKEMQKLQTSLSLATAELETMKDQMAQQESSLRLELASEMEEENRRRSETFHVIIENLKAKVHANPALAQSVRKAKMDKAEEQISEMIDKVEECEEEMVRMREHHAVEISRLKVERLEHLKESALERERLNAAHEATRASLAEEIESLKQQLAKRQEEYSKLQKSKEDMIHSYERIIREEEEEDDEDNRHDEDSNEEEEDEEVRSPRLTRMSRKRVSEVACNAAETVEVSAKKEKGGRRLRSSRVPFASVLNQRSDDPSMDSSSDDDTIGADKWILPGKPAEQDASGRYARPRGRAPSNTQWDYAVGAWRITERVV